MPNEDIRELMVAELGAVCGGTAPIAGGETIDQMSSEGNQSPIKPAEFVVLTVSSKSAR